jgi:hypothetical protein
MQYIVEGKTMKQEQTGYAAFNLRGVARGPEAVEYLISKGIDAFHRDGFLYYPMGFDLTSDMVESMARVSNNG